MKVLRAVAVLVLTGSPLSAGPLSDLIFAPSALQGGADDVLRYRHLLKIPPKPEAGSPATDSSDVLVLGATGTGQGSRLALTREADGKTAPVTDFAMTSAHPMLIYFLESTVRNMAAVTGGSSFYIRNRMREALGAADLGSLQPVTVGKASAQGYDVTLIPFADDENRARMGEFAGLTLHFVITPNRLERIVELSADTIAGGDGYHESLILLPEGE